MSRGWKYSSGDWNAICDSCGKKLKASELTKRWDGLMVCKDDYEPRHQQDFLRARKDKISVPWTRPVQDTFLPILAGLNDQLDVTDSLSTASVFNRDLSDTYVATSITEAITWLKTRGISETFNTFNDVISTAGTFNRSTPGDTATPTEVMTYTHLSALLNGAPLNSLPLG